MSTPRVFISYSHKDPDSNWITEFVSALQKQNVDVWFDKAKPRPGDSWHEALEKGLRESDAIVVLLSPSNAANPNIFFEFGLAIGTGKRLIPVIDEQVDPAAIPSEVRTRRYLIKRSPDETAQQVASAVKAA